jgi:transcription antitermination factor NusG
MHDILSNIKIEKIETHCWTPIRTKPRCEKKLAAFCHGNKIPYYLPLIKSAKRQKRENLVFHLPMFSGYAFCALNDDSFRFLVNSNCVIHKLKMDEVREKILIEELSAIKTLEQNSDDFEIVVKPEIVVGTRIKVNGGPLQGFSGIVSKRKNKALIAVNLEILGQSVSTEIDLEFIEEDEE